MATLSNLLKEISDFVKNEIRFNTTSAEYYRFLNRVNEFLRTVSSNEFLQIDVHRISKIRWGIPPGYKKITESGIAISPPITNKNLSHVILVDKQNMLDFFNGRVIILFLIIRDILGLKLTFKKDILGLLVYITFVDAFNDLKKLTIIEKFLPKWIELSTTFRPTIRSSFLALLRYFESPRKYSEKFISNIDSNYGNLTKLAKCLFHPFSIDYSILSQAELDFFQLVLKEGYKKASNYSGSISNSTKVRYLSKLQSTFFLRVRSFYSLKNLKLASYFVFIKKSTLERIHFKLDDFSFIRSIRELGSWKVANFFYRHPSEKFDSWIEYLKLHLDNDIEVYRQVDLKMYFHPELYNLDVKRWEIKEPPSMPTQVVENPRAISKLTGKHLKVALQMMKGPYSKTALVSKIGGNRNKVYQIISELEDSKTVYQKYVMGPHHSLFPIVSIGSFAESSYLSDVKRFPYAVLYELENVVDSNRITLSFFRVPPRNSAKVIQKMRKMSGNLLTDVDTAQSETFPRFTPHFARGTWKLKPLPKISSRKF